MKPVRINHLPFASGKCKYYSVLYVASLLFASICYFLIIDLCFFFNILLMFVFFLRILVSYFVYSVFLYCSVYCFSFSI